MAKFTDIEEQLLERVADDRLRTSLAVIRQAVEDIWCPDAPRIVQDYTDHGIAHSERVVGFAADLINANNGRDLSVLEMYLLLAGIYLHDVGMQCDVVKFPEIKERAEGMGAAFDVEFTAKTASGYSLDEQKAIRKNHQYLTAAWIDHASRTGDTLLGPAVKTVPVALVTDLMDVCKHHARLPITDCPLTLTLDPNGRKQWVAALLRFSDELDVDSLRVSIETVMNFSFHARNSVYWWLHSRTNVVFATPNVILLTVMLHPDDANQYGSLVHDTVITQFHSKNLRVLDVLAERGIPIRISADSRVVPEDRVERLPPEIVQALQALQKRDDPVIELAQEVGTWLQAIRYEVSDPQRHDDRTVDMLATLDLGPVRQQVLVRCIGGEITIDDVRALDEVLDRKTPQGWLISDRRVSRLARKHTGEDKAFQVFNLPDFLRQKVWGPYFDTLTSLVEREKIPDLYVDLGCFRQQVDENGHEIGRESYSSLTEYMDDWLAERGKMHISLLGEFGTGKTWFCRYYAYRQLERYLEDPADERLPLLLTLRAFAKAMTAQQLINDALLEQYKLPFAGSAFAVFQEMNRRGKLLLILDGFDEMALQVDYETVVGNFWELAKLVHEGSKVILTSRTEYFRWARESEEILSGTECGRRHFELQPPRFEVLHLESFGDDQVRDAIARRLGPQDGPVVAERVLRTPKLAEMARKPIFVELLLGALEEMSRDLVENPAQVYLYATNTLLLRDITAEKTFTSTADKLCFLCELAWEMVESGRLRIHYSAIPGCIQACFGDRITDQQELEEWDYDLRTHTVLHRDAAGNYEFPYRSLAEYFVALKFAMELDAARPEFIQGFTESQRPSPKTLEELRNTFGRRPLGPEILLLLADMVLTSRILGLLSEARNQGFDDIGYTAGNLLSILAEQGIDLAEQDLSNLPLRGSRLVNVNLRGTKFKNSDLRGAILQRVVMDDTSDLENADLHGIRFGQVPGVHGIAFCPDGEDLALACYDSVARIISVSDGSVKASMEEGHVGRIVECCFSPSGRYLATVGDDETMRIWDAQTSKLVKSFRDHEGSVFCVRFISEDLLATGGADKTLRIWSLEQENAIAVLGEHGDWVCGISVSPDGRLIASACADKGLRMWKISASKQVVDSEQVLDLKIEAHVHNVCFDANGTSVVTFSDAAVSRWWMPSGKQAWSTRRGKGDFGSFHTPLFVSENQVAVRMSHSEVCVLDLETGDIRYRFPPHPTWVSGACYDVQGRILATTSSDGTICLWNAEKGSKLRTLLLESKAATDPPGEIMELLVARKG